MKMTRLLYIVQVTSPLVDDDDDDFSYISILMTIDDYDDWTEHQDAMSRWPLLWWPSAMAGKNAGSVFQPVLFKQIN